MNATNLRKGLNDFASETFRETLYDGNKQQKRRREKKKRKKRRKRDLKFPMEFWFFG